MSLYAPYFCKLRCNPTNKKRFQQPYLGYRSEIDTRLYELSLLTMTITVTSQNIGISCWITLYLEEVSRISKRQSMVNKCVHDA